MSMVFGFPGCKKMLCAMSLVTLLSGCAEVSAPDARNVDIPTPIGAAAREKAINERPDSVMYLPLGEDVLVPETLGGDQFPTEQVGPFELRGETLAGALQLILAEYDVSLAFESQEGLTRRVTVANLRGDLGNVVHRVCSLANLYCSYESGVVTVKDRETFTVTMPPIGAGETPTAYLADIAAGLAAVLGTNGTAPIVDPSTRTIVYNATQRSAEMASRYFQRLRANTAMIVFETYIWEVTLNSGNSTGIDWDAIDTFGKFNANISLSGGAASDFVSPVSIGLPTTQAIGATPAKLIEFLSQYGAVKTISQPQITVLSGSSAELRVADTQNYVSQIATTLNNNQSTTSATTDSVDSGFLLTIGSSWDKSTVYANINIDLTNVLQIDNFTFSDGGAGGTSTSIQLPQTTQRELTTQVRVRPGDSVLIAGLVQEQDNFDSRGPGFMEPVIPDSRTATTENLELVFLLTPRVIVYTPNPALPNTAPPMPMLHSPTADAVSSMAPAPVVPAPAPVAYQPTPAPAVVAEPIVAEPVAAVPSAPAYVAPVPRAPIPAPVAVSAPAPLPVATSSFTPEPPVPARVAPVAVPEPEYMAPAPVTPVAAPVTSYRSTDSVSSNAAPAARSSSYSRYSSGYVSRSSASGTSAAAPVAPAPTEAVEIYDVGGANVSTSSSSPVVTSPAGVTREDLSSSKGYSTYGAPRKSSGGSPSLYETTEYQN